MKDFAVDEWGRLNLSSDDLMWVARLKRKVNGLDLRFLYVDGERVFKDEHLEELRCSGLSVWWMLMKSCSDLLDEQGSE